MEEHNINFDRIIDRHNTNCAKWDEMDEKYGSNDLIQLGVADMDFQSPKEIRQALQKVVDHGVFGYTNTSQLFFSSIQRWIKKQHGVEIPKEWIVFCPRINVSSSITVETFTKPGDKIIINSPAYTPLRNAIVKNNRVVVDSPLKLEGDHYSIDFKHLEEVVDEQTKMFILCSPHNPTSRVWSKLELEQLADFCEKHNLFLLSDEIHSDILRKDVSFTSTLSLSGELKNRLIYVSSLTKTFNIPGIIVSYMIIPNEKNRDKIKETIDRIGMHNPNIFSVVAMESGYTQCDEWLEQVKVYIDENEDYVRKFLNKYMPELHVLPREGTYLLWIDYSALGLSEKAMEDWFVKEAKVGVYMGSTFGPMGNGYIRLNLGTSRAILEEALERMKSVYYKITIIK